MCDLHRTEVSLLERAGREPRLATIVKLAGALKTTAERTLRGHRLAAESAALRGQAASAVLKRRFAAAAPLGGK